MRGTPVMASGIEYHERHTLTSDGQVSSRFGNPLEIPEDLMPITTDRPITLDASHPMAKFVSVYEPNGEDPNGRRLLDNCVFVDPPNGVVVELDTASKRDSFGAIAHRARTGLLLRVEYSETAIAAENDRRLKTALEIAAMFAAVIDAHSERVERERLEKEAKASVDQTTPTEE